MGIDAIIQARLGSERFPGKVLHPLQKKPLLLHIVDNLKQSSYLNRIIVATTNLPKDDRIQYFCENQGIDYFRGPENNVLDRFLGACEFYNSDRFIRVCSDNPFIDIQLLDRQVKSFGLQYDYCSYYTNQDEPLILKPIGLFVEAVTCQALIKSAELGKADKRTNEHVTFFIHSNPQYFQIKKLQLPPFINSDLRLTIDYPEDLKVCEALLAKVGSSGSRDIMSILENDRDLYERVKNRAFLHPKNY